VLLHLEAEVASLAERDFLYAARARGASVLRHAAPSLLLPVLGIAVGRASALLGGALIAEWVLSIPGWGYYSYAAARNDDPTLLVAIAVAATSAVAVLRLGAEGLRLLVDPRIRRASLAPAAGGP